MQSLLRTLRLLNIYKVKTMHNAPIGPILILLCIQEEEEAVGIFGCFRPGSFGHAAVCPKGSLDRKADSTVVSLQLRTLFLCFDKEISLNRNFLQCTCTCIHCTYCTIVPGTYPMYLVHCKPVLLMYLLVLLLSILVIRFLASVTVVVVVVPAAAAAVAVSEDALAPRHLELCVVLLTAVGARVVQRLGHV